MIKFRVVPDSGEPYEVTGTARDILVWEKTVKGASYASLMRSQNMGDLYRIAHLASRRLGLFGGDLREFEDTCDLMPLPEEEDSGEADPTPPGA